MWSEVILSGEDMYVDALKGGSRVGHAEDLVEW